jgi:nitrogen fixation protein NifT
MPSVMIRDVDGDMTLYIPKKDLEEKIVSIEHTQADCWGGKFELADGSSYYIEPMSTMPDLPITLRAKRGE